MTTTSLELAAVRVEPKDTSASAALDRVHDLEGQPVTDETWASMVALARYSVGGGPDSPVDEHRDFGDVSALGTALVVIRWQGNAADIYFEAGDSPEEPFQDVLDRLRDAGLTIIQGHDRQIVAPGTSLADMVAAQHADTV
jgi:hypothetical protein